MVLKKKVLRLISNIREIGFYKAAVYYIHKKRAARLELKEIQKCHLIEEGERKRQKEERFAYSPCVSIITPLYNTPPSFLKDLLDSVQKQTYANWELCLADGSDEQHKYVGEMCIEYAEKDSRFVYKKLKRNDGIVGNTNQAIKMCSGEYCGLLDHDDILHESALYECIKEIQNRADFVYTDEMKFRSTVEQSSDIICKPGFGKDELRSHNYICHFVMFRKKLLDGMDALYRKECEGSQDYDMVLRLTERAEKIVHIPKILYYWRVHSESVAMDLSVKAYAVDAAKRAIADQLCRLREAGEVMCNLPYQTIYRIKYNINRNPLVSICVWGENIKDLNMYLKTLLDHTEYRPLEIIFSSCEQLGITFQTENVNIIEEDYWEGELSYEWLERIRGILHGEYIVFLNSQCMPIVNDWIQEMLMYAQREDVGIVGTYIISEEGKVYFGGGVLDSSGHAGVHLINYGIKDIDQGYEANMRYTRNTTVLSALGMMIAKKRMEELGGFRMEMGDCCDIDLCLRSRRDNYWNVWNCFAKLYYSGHKEIFEYWSQDEKLKTTWEKEIESGDVFYNPVLKKLKKV